LSRVSTDTSESQERGDTFTSHALSCICKDGFVGDGLTCYDPKLCSDSSCCDRGYHWSSEKGCVDIDECSLPNSPCTPPQICHNTPGSYECPEPSSKNRAAASSQSVQFYCGNTVCPSGTDCINSQCVDPCENYATLNDDWRSTNNTNTEVLHCDKDINWKGWYRLFLNQTSAHIPERCVESNRCGTHAPLWITQPHPTWSGEIVNRTVCNVWEGSCCHFRSHTIHVKLCHANYYVYKLVKPYTCLLAYCQQVVSERSLHYIIFFPFVRFTGGISGSGPKARASMSLFRNSNYTESYPPGQVFLPVGSPLYVGVSVEDTDPVLAAVLEDCYATHSPNPDDPTQYPLIQNKCPTDPQKVSIVESGSSLRARFSALLFLLQGEYRDIYLHCSLSLCNQRNYNCVPVSSTFHLSPPGGIKRKATVSTLSPWLGFSDLEVMSIFHAIV
uniref:ZP domain-containing protein n=1 Tax=Neolamprologus brichardi TaxID=32507 RepID=A0A3Q4NAR0_NEOBR